MKKRNSLVLAAALFAAGMLCMNGIPASAAEEMPETGVREENIQLLAAQSGTCGENVTWSLDEGNGTLTISGSGAMSAIPSDIRSAVRSVVIGNGVTGIGDGAFRNCGSLTGITFSGSITSIGNSAFENCTSLTQVTIPDSVRMIGTGAFAGCTSLTSVYIPKDMETHEYMGEVAYPGAFSGCSSLTSLPFL